MIRRFTPTLRVALATALMTSVVATASSASAPVARADTPPTWWVAASGTAADPATNGTSCANPSFVGATHTSIQAAIDAAASGDVVRICSGTYLMGASLGVGKNLSIVGDGDTMPILDGAATHRIMSIDSGATTVGVTGLQFQNGKVTGEQNRGAAIRQHPDTNLTVNDSYFVDNVAADDHGGGIALVANEGGANSGSLQVMRSTFVRNGGVDGGGITVVGMENQSTVQNSTFVGNFATREGGAVNGSFSNFRAINSTFIDNTAPAGGDNSWNVAMTGNIIAYSPSVTHSADTCVFSGDAPTSNVSDSASCIAGGETTTTYADLQIGILAPWGGKTYTVSIGATSSAIGTVNSSHCPEFDQRGESRAGATCDAGAFEHQSGAPSITPSGALSLLKGRSISPAVTFGSAGLTAPVTFRVVSDLGGTFPGGVTFSTSTGQISGTPSASSSARQIIISAKDSAGKIASAKVTVDNCLLTSSDGKYQVATAAHLQVFAAGGCGWDATYVQTADIELSGEWESLTSYKVPFTGTYDGDGHSINGLQMSSGQAAFITYTQGATIKDLEFEATMSGSYASTGLISNARGTSVVGVRGSGSVTIAESEPVQGCHGGLVGELYGLSTVSNSSFEGTVSAPNGAWVGGLVGCADDETSIDTSAFMGSVSGKDEVGGIVGWMAYADIRNSYAEGSVTGSGTSTGGLAGTLDRDGSDGDSYAITNSYSRMSIQGVNRVGALSGAGQATAIAPSAFWESGLSGVEGLEPLGYLGEGETTQPALTASSSEAMKSHATFEGAGWSIADGWEDPSTTSFSWGICDGTTRPFLMWQHATDACAASVPTTTTTTTTTLAPTTTMAPTTTVRTVTTTTVFVAPVAAGRVGAYVGGKKTASTVKWTSTSKLVGKVGKVGVLLTFGRTFVSPTQTASVKAGATFSLFVTGLKGRSKASATLFPAQKSIGKFVAMASGSLKSSATIPKNTRPGTYRLRITMVNKDGKEFTVWLGLRVKGVAKSSLHRT